METTLVKRKDSQFQMPVRSLHSPTDHVPGRHVGHQLDHVQLQGN